MPGRRKNTWIRAYVGLAGAGLLAGRVVMAAGWIPAPRIQLTWDRVDRHRLSARSDTLGGPEIAVVAIVSPSCAWCRVDSLAPAIRKAQTRLRRSADSSGVSFAYVGIAQSDDVQEGMSFLKRFGPFDEVAAGHGWMNTALLRYVHETYPARAATPQVVVLYRTLDSGPGMRFADERVLLRKIGVGPILQWANSGAAIPLPNDVAH